MTASLTCDADLQFTLLNYLRKKLDNRMINVYIGWICKATSVTSHSYKATSCTLYNAASAFLISLWIQCYTYILTCYDPISSCAPMVPFFLLLPSFLMLLTHPFQTCRLILCCSFFTNSLQLSSQHPQTHWLHSFFKCSSNPIFNQHTAAQFCLLFAYYFLYFISLLTFCSYHFSLQRSITLSIFLTLL